MVQSTRHRATRGAIGPIGLLVASACLVAVSLSLFLSRDTPRTLRLSELRAPQAEALSCADPAAPAQPVLAWCSDPSSPQCLPALPPHASVDLHDVQPATFMALIQLPRARNVLATTPWQMPRAERTPGSRDGDRLERPPRA